MCYDNGYPTALPAKVYLAELIRHFFPGRDLAPPRPFGRRDTAAPTKRTATREKIDPTGADGGDGGKRRSSIFDHVRGKGEGKGKGKGKSGFKGPSSTFAGASHNFSSVVQSLNLSTKVGAARRAAVNLQGVPRRSRSTEGTGDAGGGEGADRDGGVGASEETSLQDVPRQTRETAVTPAANLGVLLQHATREVGEGKKTGAGGLWEDKKEKQEEMWGEKDGEEERQPLTPAVHGDSHVGKDIAGKTVRRDSRANLDFVSADESSTSHRQTHQSDHQRGGAASLAAQQQKRDASDKSSAASFIGDNFSTTQLHQKGRITVYVPHSPNPGVWAASVEYDGDRDVSWVLAEALRMYKREHSPVVRHAGLARRPRLVQRSRSTALGLQQEPALSPASPVVSVLRPGEELVVLVEGFDPAAAFSTRPSVVASPPTRAGAGGDFASCGADGSDLVSSERSGLPSLLPRPPPAEKRGGRSGTTPTREGEVSGSSQGRAQTDGVRRFAGVDESMGTHGGCSPPKTGKMNARGDDGSGVGRDYANNVVAKSGQAPGMTGAEERLRMRFGGFAGVSTNRNREASGHEGERTSSVDEDDDDDYDDDSLTDEEDEEEGRENYYHRNPFYGQEDAAIPQEGGGGGGGAWLGRNGSGYGSPPRSRNDVSATTRGLAERCEDDGEAEGDRTTADGERHRGQRQTGQGFPEPRSPPRSLVLEMFSAWRRG